MHLEYAEEIRKILHHRPYTIVGTNVRRVDGINKITGMAKYSADMLMKSALIVKAVRSPYPHAIVKNINKESACKIPGVECVITGEDVPGTNDIGYYLPDQPLLTDRARFIGDTVALIVAHGEEAAWQGADALEVEYEELPAIFDPEEALRSDVKIHAEGNIASNVSVIKGDADEAFKHCDIIIERDYQAGSQDHAYLETEAALAVPFGHRFITIIGTNQGPSRTRSAVAQILGWNESEVTIVTPYVGGGFGGKDAYGPVISSMAALAAVVTGKPAAIVYSRYESYAFRYKRGPFSIKYKTGWLALYAHLAESADKGAVLRFPEEI